MKITDKKRLLEHSIYELMIEQKQIKVESPCHICNSDSDLPSHAPMHIEGDDIEIGYALCENCYDNLRFKIDDNWDDFIM